MAKIKWSMLSAEAKATIAASPEGANGHGVEFDCSPEEYVALRARAPRDAFAKLSPAEQERVMAEGAARSAAASVAKRAAERGVENPLAPSSKATAAGGGWSEETKARMRISGLPTEPLPYRADASEHYLSQRAAQQAIASGHALGGALVRRERIGAEKHDAELAASAAISRALSEPEA